MLRPGKRSQLSQVRDTFGPPHARKYIHKHRCTHCASRCGYDQCSSSSIPGLRAPFQFRLASLCPPLGTITHAHTLPTGFTLLPSGNSLRLLMSCERPSTGTCAPAPELDNYCSTMADAYEDGMPCKAVVFSAGNAGAAARPNSNSSSKGAVAGAVEKASQLAAEQIMIECSPESASIPSVTPSAPAKHPLSSDEDLNSASAVRERTVKRRAHRQLSSQRHNASDGKPILLRRRSEDSTFEGSAAAAAVRDRESVLRRLSHSVVHVLRLLLTLGHHSHSSGSSSGDAAAKDKSRSQTRGGHGRGHHGKVWLCFCCLEVLASAG